MQSKPKILIAPLNWGLGHATRCIPIIRLLLSHGYEPILGSDGGALQLLKKEFPALESVKLPSYKISYSKKGKNFKRKMLLNAPKIAKAILAEKRIINKLVKQGKIDGIISDNRIGVFHKSIPTVFVTHQLNVLSGKTTKLSSAFHQLIIKQFDECWVPDNPGNQNLSGKLGHLTTSKINLKYIGPLSRFEKKDVPIKYEYLALLSGPEPQRTLLEKKLFDSLRKTNKKVLFVRGKIEEKQESFNFENLTVYNYMTSSELEDAINASETIISRSGYTTIMDLAKLEKKAFFIPTPGQFEQIYLAKRLKNLQIIPSCQQDKFSLTRLNEVDLYSGLTNFKATAALSRALLEVFHSSKSSSTSSSSSTSLAVDFSKVNENSEPTPNSLST